MERLGYITLAEAEELTGIKADTWKTRCQEGRVAGAVNRDNKWLVPKTEVIKLPESSRDIFLNSLVFASNAGVEIPISLFINGIQLTGRLASVKDYVEALDDELFKGLKSAKFVGADGMGVDVADSTDASTDAEIRRFVELLLKSPADQDKTYSEVYGDRSKHPIYYDYCHLKDVKKHDGHQWEQLGDKIMRIKISSIDAYQVDIQKKN